jgi:IS30 family transposase
LVSKQKRVLGLMHSDLYGKISPPTTAGN